MVKKGNIPWNKGIRTLKNCIICNQQFPIKRSKTCSSECRKVYWRQKMQEVYDSPKVKEKISQSMISQYQNGTRDKFKITQKAHEEIRRKSDEKFKKNPTIKIGKRGYKLIYIPRKGWKYYHHFIWEKHYGEKIEKGLCLHHIDGDPLNNKISNLMKLSRRDHAKLKKR